MMHSASEVGDRPVSQNVAGKEEMKELVAEHHKNSKMTEAFMKRKPVQKDNDYAEEERNVFAKTISKLLGKEPELKEKMPLSEDDVFFF